MRFLFEDYVLDEARHELRRGDEIVPVEARVFALLTYLIRNRERVVSKEDVLSRTCGAAALSSRLRRCDKPADHCPPGDRRQRRRAAVASGRSRARDFGSSHRLSRSRPACATSQSGTRRQPDRSGAAGCAAAVWCEPHRGRRIGRVGTSDGRTSREPFEPPVSLQPAPRRASLAASLLLSSVAIAEHVTTSPDEKIRCGACAARR